MRPVVDTQFVPAVYPREAFDYAHAIDWLAPPHLGDWLELQAWPEAWHPRREGTLVIAGSPRAGEVMLSPAGACFPFGVESAHRLGQGRGGAVQRPYNATQP